MIHIFLIFANFVTCQKNLDIQYVVHMDHTFTTTPHTVTLASTCRQVDIPLVYIFSEQYCSDLNIEKCHLQSRINAKKWLLSNSCMNVSINENYITLQTFIVTMHSNLLNFKALVCVAPKNNLSKAQFFFFQRLSTPCTCSLNNNTGHIVRTLITGHIVRTLISCVVVNSKDIIYSNPALNCSEN